jgi:hypothetical protein
MAGPRTVRVRRTARRPLGRGHTVAAAALAVFAAVALPVLASHLFITDPNDTRGLLDVHEVRFRDADGSPPSWTVITFSDWTPRKLWDRGYVLLNLDTLGTAETDYYALVRADRDRLRGSMWRHRTEAPDVRLFNVEVHKRGDHGVAVWVPLRRLVIGAHRSVYRWSVTTLFTGGTCRRTCVDLAPDDSMVEQPIATSSPTPSPT